MSTVTLRLEAQGRTRGGRWVDALAQWPARAVSVRGEAERCPPLAGTCAVGQGQAPRDPLEGTFLPCTVPAWSCLCLEAPGTPSLHMGNLEDGGVIAPKWGSTRGPGVDRPMSSLLSPGGTSEGCSTPEL